MTGEGGWPIKKRHRSGHPKTRLRTPDRLAGLNITMIYSSKNHAKIQQAITMPNNTISQDKSSSANGPSVSLMLELPWPSRALSPNTRQHWSALSKAKKAYRTRCKQLAEAMGAGPVENASTAVLVDLTFFPPDRRARDLDNLLASMKSGLDGVADAIGVDDSKWSLKISKSQEVVKGGVVLVNLEISHV